MPAKKAFAEEPTITKIMQLFAKQGYYNTSLDEIVTTSGVKKTKSLQYFWR